MKARRPRVLVLADAKETAESIRRGLSMSSGLDLELEIALDPVSVDRQLEDCRYDLLLAGREFLNGGSRSILGRVPPDLPLLAVGGDPGDAPPDGFCGRVIPLPLSFTLLANAVRTALSGFEPDRPSRRELKEREA